MYIALFFLLGCMVSCTSDQKKAIKGDQQLIGVGFGSSSSTLNVEGLESTKNIFQKYWVLPSLIRMNLQKESSKGLSVLLLPFRTCYLLSYYRLTIPLSWPPLMPLLPTFWYNMKAFECIHFLLLQLKRPRLSWYPKGSQWIPLNLMLSPPSLHANRLGMMAPTYSVSSMIVLTDRRIFLLSENYVLNPERAGLNFKLREGRYLSAEQLNQALQDSLRFVLLDA